jgi:hypothetical protein
MQIKDLDDTSGVWVEFPVRAIFPKPTLVPPSDMSQAEILQHNAKVGKEQFMALVDGYDCTGRNNTTMISRGTVHLQFATTEQAVRFKLALGGEA